MATAVRFHALGDAGVLRLEEVAVPPPGPGEVLLDIAAIGLNRAEVLFRSGRYLEQARLPAGLGFEAAGRIAAIGPGVDALAVGDRVATTSNFSQNDYPVYATQALVPARAVLAIPPGQDDVSAAAVWIGSFTAWGALVEMAGLGAGQHVLVTAATGSTGLAGIQIANAVGAIPIATTRSRDKVQPLLHAGAAHVLVDGEDDLLDRLMAITAGKGIEVAYDAVAGPGIATIAEAMADEGNIVVYGGLSPEPTIYPRQLFTRKGLKMQGFLTRQIYGRPDRFERGRRFLYDAIERGAVTPIVDRIFPLSAVQEAHRYLESGQHLGKVVMTTGGA